MLNRRLLAVAVTTLLATLALSPVGAPSAGVTTAALATPATSSQVVHDWERTLIRTVYTENVTPIPSGVPYLGFTSVAMYDALKRAVRNHGSPTAAIATAAHDVLLEYFPASATNLATDLAASLADVPDGPYGTRGKVAGANAAQLMIDRREDDGRDDATVVYDRDEAPGVWQPVDPAGNPVVPPFLAPWLGFVDPLVLNHRVRVNGPDPITTAAYAFDYLEVKRVGIAGPTADRTPYQTQTALFFTASVPVMFTESLVNLLEDASMNLRSTARMFARMHGAMTDSIITCWRLKYDEAFWRPFQAIQGAASDDNPATVADPAWTPLVPNPPYPDYLSGHGCLTSPAVEVIRRTLGEETAMTLHSSATGAGPDRTYGTLSEIEFDTFHARIWGGLHFRDAMEDSYYMGHETARRVMSRID